MTAKTAVADGRLTNEELGALGRRWSGVLARLDARSVSFDRVMDELQRIAEDREESRGMRMVFDSHCEVSIGGMTPGELLRAVEEDCRIEKFAREMFSSSQFTTATLSQKVELTFLTPMVFGTLEPQCLFNSEWLALWSEQHLYRQIVDICPAEVGPAMVGVIRNPRYWYREFCFAMQLVPTRNGRQLFTARCGHDNDRTVRILSSVNREWAPCDLLVYQIRKVST